MNTGGSYVLGRPGSSAIVRPGTRIRSNRTKGQFAGHPDDIQMDWEKDFDLNLYDLLGHVIKTDAGCRGLRMSSLNQLTRLWLRLVDSDATIDFMGFHAEEVFSILRIGLYSEHVEVRASSLRCMRHLIRGTITATAFIKANIPLLLVRSLDIVLENKMERIQAIKLMRHLMQILPGHIPMAIVRCVLTLSRDGVQERDILTRCGWATLARMAIMNPSMAATTGILGILLDCAQQPGQPPAILQSLVSCLLFLLNHPQFRVHLRDDLDLQQFASHLTDCYSLPSSSTSNSNAQAMQGPPGKPGGGHAPMAGAAAAALSPIESNEPHDQREMRMSMSKKAVIQILRSWPGLIYFCRWDSFMAMGGTEESDRRDLVSNGMSCLMQTLRMPYPDGARHVMDLVFTLLNRYCPPDTEDINQAIVWTQPHKQQHESWQMYDGFVAAEGSFLMQHGSKRRMNLMQNYLSLVISALISHGLIESLITVIVEGGNKVNSVKGIILLGEILHLSSRLLPLDMYRRCHALPQLMLIATSPEYSVEQRSLASGAITCLDKIHNLRTKRDFYPHSLYLDQLVRFAGSAPEDDEFLPPTISKGSSSVSRSPFAKNGTLSPSVSTLKWGTLSPSGPSEWDEGHFQQVMRQSNVIGQEPTKWDWPLISVLLQYPIPQLVKMDEPIYRTFLRKLLIYFNPKSKMYSNLDATEDKHNGTTQVMFLYIDFLVGLTEEESPKGREFVNEFLSDLKSDLQEVTGDHGVPSISVFSTTKVMTSLSHCYFLMIGRMSSTPQGVELIIAHELDQVLLDLVEVTSNEVYPKLVISCLDYNRPESKFPRAILERALLSTFQPTRWYATKFTRILLRSGLKDWNKWPQPLVMTKLFDEDSQVYADAFDIMLEATESPVNIDALVHHPEVFKLLDLRNDHHYRMPIDFIIIKFLSTEKGIRFLQQHQKLDPLVAKWTIDGGLSHLYPRIVEDVLSDTFTSYSFTMEAAAEEGIERNMSHREGSNQLMDPNPLVPPHMMSELAHTRTGFTLLKDKVSIVPLINIVNESKVETERDRVLLKGALWSLGSLATTTLGFEWITSVGSQVIQDIVTLARCCPVMSMRGVAYFVLGQFCCTEGGCDELESYGWNGLRHGYNDVWPSNPDLDLVHSSCCFMPGGKQYSYSVSSGGTNHPPSRNHSFKASFLNHKHQNPLIVPSPIGSYLGSSPPSVSIPQSQPETQTNGDVKGKEPNGKEIKIKIPSLIVESSHEDTVPTMNPEVVDSADHFPYNQFRPGGGGGGGRPNNNEIHDYGQEAPTFLISDINGDKHSNGHDVMEPKSVSNSMSNSIVLRTLKSHFGHMSLRGLKGGLDTVHATGSIDPIRLRYDSIGMYDDEPTQQDADGYATIQSIAKHRGNSVGLFDPVDGTRIKSPSVSSNLNEDFLSHQSDQYHFLPQYMISPFRPRAGTIGRMEYSDLVDPITYMAIAHPSSLSLLMVPPEKEYKPQDIPSDCTFESSFNGLELHQQDNCIMCYRTDCGLFPRPLLSPPKWHKMRDSPGSGAGPSFTPSNVDTVTEDNETDASPCPTPSKSLDTTSVTVPTKGNVHPHASNMVDGVMLRREILRFVTNLSGSVAARAAEQGLLNLKQKYPSSFEDLCLYSEIALQLSAYNFRLSARRFLQEIFLEINYDPLKTYAMDLMQKRKPDLNNRKNKKPRSGDDGPMNNSRKMFRNPDFAADQVDSIAPFHNPFYYKLYSGQH